jgi:hypothetical protein
MLLFVAGLLPTGQLGAIAAASLPVAAAIIETDIPRAVIVYVVGCLIGLLNSPNKPLILPYAMFAGYYPIVKCLAERTGKMVAGWLIKLAVFNAALSALWLLFRTALTQDAGIRLGTLAVYIAGNAVFVVYDIGLTKLIGAYINRIAGRNRQ